MVHIYSSDPMAPGVKVLAEMWHRSCGDGRPRAIRMYRLYRKAGEDAEEYLLTRYEGMYRERGKIPMSALLRVEGQSFERKFTQVWTCPRAEEPEYILQWQEQNGAIMDAPRS